MFSRRYLINAFLCLVSLHTFLSFTIYSTQSADDKRICTGFVSYKETANSLGQSFELWSIAAFVVPRSFSARPTFFSSFWMIKGGSPCLLVRTTPCPSASQICKAVNNFRELKRLSMKICDHLFGRRDANHTTGFTMRDSSRCLNWSLTFGGGPCRK